MRFQINTLDELIPAVPPPGGSPARTAPTTQVLVRAVEWPGNVFRLWLPEQVGDLWSNWQAETARQNFQPTGRGGLLWHYQGHPAAVIETEVVPRPASLELQARVTNCSTQPLAGVRVSHCFQLSQAPDFACGDFSRLYLRANGRWQALADLRPATDYPHYFRAGARAAGDGLWEWEARLAHLNESLEADSSLIVCVSKDGARSVGTASDNCRFLFHNRANANLWCLHSQQAPLAALAPGQTAEFRQTIFFVEGGLAKCAAAYEQALEQA